MTLIYIWIAGCGFLTLVNFFHWKNAPDQDNIEF